MTERLRPFDTIRSTGGITYVSEQLGNRPDSESRAHISYIPVEGNSGRRIYPDGPFQKKLFFDGFRAEAESLKHIRQPLHNEISTSYRIDPRTGESYIAIPNNRIEVVTHSGQALIDILHGRINAPGEVVEAVGLAIDWITQESSIPEENLGIYGGTAAGIFRVGGTGPVDVDLTVFDLTYAGDVIKFCSSHQPEDISKLYTSKRTQQEERGLDFEHMKRKSPQHSAFPAQNHALHGKCYVDIWMVRRDDDYPMIPDVSLSDRYTVRTCRGRVQESRGSLALPAHYIIKRDDGTVLNVLSPRFHFLASARIGEAVEVTGLSIEDTGWMLLTDPQTHKFTYLSG